MPKAAGQTRKEAQEALSDNGPICIDTFAFSVELSCLGYDAQGQNCISISMQGVRSPIACKLLWKHL